MARTSSDGDMHHCQRIEQSTTSENETTAKCTKWIETENPVKVLCSHHCSTQATTPISHVVHYPRIFFLRFSVSADACMRAVNFANDHAVSLRSVRRNEFNSFWFYQLAVIIRRNKYEAVSTSCMHVCLSHQCGLDRWKWNTVYDVVESSMFVLCATVKHCA